MLPGGVPPVLLPGEGVRRVVLEERRRRRVVLQRLQRRRVRQPPQVGRPHGQPGGGGSGGGVGVGLQGRVGRVSLLLSAGMGRRGG